MSKPGMNFFQSLLHDGSVANICGAQHHLRSRFFHRPDLLPHLLVLSRNLSSYQCNSCLIVVRKMLRQRQADSTESSSNQVSAALPQWRSKACGQRRIFNRFDPAAAASISNQQVAALNHGFGEHLRGRVLARPVYVQAAAAYVGALQR